MNDRRPGLIRRIWSGFWRLVEGLRRFVFNLAFLLILVVVALAVVGGGHTKVRPDTALVIDLQGALVEQYTGSAQQAELARGLGSEVHETQLRDLVRGIDHATQDKRIVSAVLLLDDAGAAGLPKLRELAAALDRFKAAGKRVVAWSAEYDNKRYFLASHATEIYAHPLGGVLLTGFGGYRNYYHDALERLGVSVHVFRVGKYKSFVEPYIGNGPSPDAAQAESFWLNGAWSDFTHDVESARHLPAGAIDDLIGRAPELLREAGGDGAKLALNSHLIDGIKTRDELRQLMMERGKPDDDGKSFRQISLDAYLDDADTQGDPARQVGIVVAEGDIVDGDAMQGVVGGRSTAALLRRAREDKAVKAIVLRVDSPGGSVYGSELVRRELELARQGGKPVVVSMSDVAASGGYWISTAADAVIADPDTITGSIGVFGVLPTAERGLEKLGIHTGGTTTAWLAGAYDPRRPIDPRAATMIQDNVEHLYREFLTRVAGARHSDPAQINEVAQGRVWTGRQAFERGLIDKLGGLGDAVASAVALAKLEPGYRVTYLESESPGLAKLLTALPGGLIRSWIAPMNAWGLAPWGATAAVSSAATPALPAELGFLLEQAQRPGARLAHCLCAAP